jgi:hypothetical protein
MGDLLVMAGSEPIGMHRRVPRPHLVRRAWRRLNEIRYRLGLGGLTKSDIIHRLARRRRYRRCLELRTTLTGRDCRIDPRRFDAYQLLLYRPDGSDRDEVAAAVRRFGPDIALLDPWHSYEMSWRDLTTVFDALPAGGALVCHDCHPARVETTDPEGWGACMVGELWSGLTFMAWVDFLIDRRPSYRTVDTDFGCGVAVKGEPTPIDPVWIRRWREIGGPGPDTFRAAHAFLRADGLPLLRLTRPREFLSSLGSVGPC